MMNWSRDYDKNKILPIYGVGPVYVISCLFLTIIALIFNCYKIIPVLKFLYLFMIILGILCITIGVILWLSAVLVTKIDRKIKEGKLITTGIYSIVRNPIYSAFLFIFTGIIFLVNNIYLLVLPISFNKNLNASLVSSSISSFLKRITEKKSSSNLSKFFSSKSAVCSFLF